MQPTQRHANYLSKFAILVLFYLSPAKPAGPDAIKNSLTFFAQEKKAPTRARIDPGNYISFKSPWKIEGELTRESADAVRFRIHEILGGQIKEERQMVGYWSKHGHIH